MVSSGNAALIARFRRGLAAEAKAVQRKPEPPICPPDFALKDASGLLVYQPRPAAQLSWALKHNGAAIDGSDAGCHEKGTEILMYSGDLKKVEDVREGDLLMGPGSTPRKVLRTVRGVGTMARIVPVKGDPFVVNEDHILSLWRSQHKRGKPDTVDVSVWERDIVWTKTEQDKWKLFREPANFPDRHCSRWIDPYLLGVLLGDGCLLRDMLSVTTADRAIEQCVEQQAPVLGYRIVRVAGRNCTSLIFRGAKEVKSELKFLGLLGRKSHDKFIPRTYKLGPKEVRQGVLAGLLDTDGHLCDGLNSYDFVSKSEQLARGVAFLCRSLGYAAYVRSCEKKCQTGAIGGYFRVSISGDLRELPLRVKIPEPRRQKKSVLRTGFSVEWLGRGDYYGFALDGDGRFLLGDFTVTHNTGKTYTTLAACRDQGISPVVVCPKAVVPSWDRAARHLGVRVEDIVSWELIRVPGRTKWFTKGKRWLAPPIFDEAHRAKAFDTLNSEMVIEARRSEVPTILASATAAVTPVDMRAIGYVLGLHEWQNFQAWARSYGCRKGLNGLRFLGSDRDLQRLHALIYPRRGVRVRIADLGNLFPETQILAEAFAADNCDEIQRAYDEMEAELQQLAETMQQDTSGVLTELLRSRQKIELLKVPLLASLVRDGLDAGQRVAVFVNYTQTRLSLLEKLQSLKVSTGSIHGGQTVADRQAVIDGFQADTIETVVSNIAAGGVGISLHDIRGEFPRLALICPDFSAVNLKQVLGRVHRAGGKTTSQQKIVFVSGTAEDGVCRSVANKLRNLDLLNDGDLCPESVSQTLQACYHR